MKYKILSGLGIVVAILMTLIEGACLIYNLGCIRIIHGNHYYELMPFNWNTIGVFHWILWAVAMAWYSLLIIPWIQYFNGLRRRNSFIPTLAGGGSIVSVGYIMCNIAIAIGAAAWFNLTGDPDEMGHYADFDNGRRHFLMMLMFFLSMYYVPHLISVIERLNKWSRNIV